MERLAAGGQGSASHLRRWVIFDTYAYVLIVSLKRRHAVPTAGDWNSGHWRTSSKPTGVKNRPAVVDGELFLIHLIWPSYWFFNLNNIPSVGGHVIEHEDSGAKRE